MDLICYAASGFPDGTAFLARLRDEVPVDHFAAFQTIEELQSGLLRPMGDVLAVVLFPADDVDLTRILTLQDVMNGTRIIFVLPVWDPQMVTGAHFLRPRFVTSLEKDFSEVGAVLRKMAARFGSSSICSSGNQGGNVHPG
jgi:hypothetical protein